MLAYRPLYLRHQAGCLEAIKCPDYLVRYIYVVFPRKAVTTNRLYKLKVIPFYYVEPNLSQTLTYYDIFGFPIETSEGVINNLKSQSIVDLQG